MWSGVGMKCGAAMVCLTGADGADGEQTQGRKKTGTMSGPEDENNPSDGFDPEDPQLPRQVVLVLNAAVMYPLMAALAFGLSYWLLDRSPLTALGDGGLSLPWKVGLGAGLGLLVYGLDNLLERVLPFFQRMAQAFGDLLGGLGPGQVLAMAVLSSVGEEIFFRGFVQVGAEHYLGSYLPGAGLIVSSIFFGLLHIAPDRRLWAWPLLAIAMGFAFGWLFDYTGDVLAPILAHFTINFFSLMALSRRHGADETAPT